MLAVDTNVVVRYLTGDHPEQFANAKALIDGEDLFVCATVLLETEWVLRSVYGYPRLSLHERSGRSPDCRGSLWKTPP